MVKHKRTIVSGQNGEKMPFYIMLLFHMTRDKVFKQQYFSNICKYLIFVWV